MVRQCCSGLWLWLLPSWPGLALLLLSLVGKGSLPWLCELCLLGVRINYEAMSSVQLLNLLFPFIYKI